MKRIGMFLFLSFIITVSIKAQDKPKADAPKDGEKPAAGAAAAMPTLDDILDKFVKAVGGREAIEKLKSRTVKGTFEIEAMSISGPFESWEKAPNKNSTLTSVPNMGSFITVYDGTKG